MLCFLEEYMDYSKVPRYAWIQNSIDVAKAETEILRVLRRRMIRENRLVRIVVSLA